MCACREGYAGFHCDRCALGFRNFPACEPCPCDQRGSEHAADCDDGECFCKVCALISKTQSNICT